MGPGELPSGTECSQQPRCPPSQCMARSEPAPDWRREEGREGRVGGSKEEEGRGEKEN